MHPRTEGNQRCIDFDLTIQPKAKYFSYHDFLGNIVDHFDVPQYHNSLTITAESHVQIDEPLEIPAGLTASTWDALDALKQSGDYWDMLQSSQFATQTPLLLELAEELHLSARRDDPLTLLLEVNVALYHIFDYAPNSTKVDSPIDVALKARQGVCQDFSHIMISLVRHLGIPCRYVSGYIIPTASHDDRSPEHASHAWVEAFLPELGWIGFDPTNNLINNERHIAVAVGRDYADVSPTKGVFKGEAKTELVVGVQVKPMDNLPFEEDLLPEDTWETYDPMEHQQLQLQQQQQQQQ